MNRPRSSNYDVIVIGAGPAGSTTAALLAMKGRKVLVIEREKFPRYHIGESLMPYCWYTFERLGVLEKLDAIAFQRKYSVQFVTPDGRQSAPFYFFQHRDHPSSITWQVERADFDLMLLNNAREKGAEVLEETAVLHVIRNDSGTVIGVEAESRDGGRFSVFAAVTIDCSGREQVAVGREGWRVKDPYLNKLAIWTYFKGGRRDPGIDEGNTTVAYVEGRGWFWYIPLRGDMVSVGIVAEKEYLFSGSREPREILHREVEKNAWLKAHLDGIDSTGQYWVTSEFSYRSKYCAADGLLLAGDAFAFLDPVFSSGVFLALKSGEMAADAADAALAVGDTSAARFAEYGERLCSAVENMRAVVYAFYDKNFSFAKLLRQYPEHRPMLTDCLIGDLVGRDYSELFARIAEFAMLPAPLPHGRAMVLAETSA
jgi:flavin-dependent dehydrogenase